MHFDIAIGHQEPHKKYDGLIHDIAMLYLKHEVKSTGWLKIIFQEEMNAFSQMK